MIGQETKYDAQLTSLVSHTDQLVDNNNLIFSFIISSVQNLEIHCCGIQCIKQTLKKLAIIHLFVEHS